MTLAKKAQSEASAGSAEDSQSESECRPRNGRRRGKSSVWKEDEYSKSQDADSESPCSTEGEVEKPKSGVRFDHLYYGEVDEEREDYPPSDYSEDSASDVDRGRSLLGSDDPDESSLTESQFSNDFADSQRAKRARADRRSVHWSGSAYHRNRRFEMSRKEQDTLRNRKRCFL